MTRRVVILGGGIAGLSAAETLARSDEFKRGELELSLLEARSSTGGRAGSFVERETGQTVDYCQHVAMGCCTTLLSLLQRMDLLRHFQRYEALTFYHPDHGFSRFEPNKWLPAPLHLAMTLTSLKHLSSRDQKLIRKGLWRLMRTKSSDLVGVTAKDWLVMQGQEQSCIEKFWSVILVSALGDTIDRVSMQAARKVIVDGFAGARDASDVWVPRLPLSKIFGDEFSGRIRGMGVDLQLRSPVRELQRTQDAGTWEIHCSGGSRLVADDVLVATPWHVSRRWFPELWGQSNSAAEEKPSDSETPFESSPITGVHLWLDRSLTELPHVAMVGTLTHWLFREPLDSHAEATTQVDGVYHQVVISGRHGGEGWSGERLVAEVMKELEAAFPEVGTPNVLNFRVVTDPNAVFSVSPATERCRPSVQTEMPGLYLAGDAVATGWPSTMEGAAISGQMAAKAVLGALAASNNEADHFRGEPPGLPKGLLARWLIR
ncbi:hydroxysqualene dehydroxylase HpnE [Rhodopirellula sp. JC740]|uniref:Hydroxysqualene dehydroxylase HpnE n=1 Tax=Rhodopirellula halodulae TaxID=2894198 RepID=A0ABS8NJG4_9BACT|nr:hydroxysqualene dehydroxylase HpnE [Rhodopirellula sp. JC740]MCC9643711.1 hydroxysqualene dehydroxylase HpnE [Rhodopirellula sp. JC740]